MLKKLITSRELWVSLLGLFVILLGQVIPGFKIDLGEGAALLIVVASYLYGVTVDPGPGGWQGWIQSRKFWGALVGFVLVILKGANVVLPPDLTPEMLVILSTLIGALVVTWSKQPAPVKPSEAIGFTAYHTKFPPEKENKQ